MSLNDKLIGIDITYSLCKESTMATSSVVTSEAKGPGVISKMGGPMAYARVYFEAFLYFIIGALDLLASINYYFIYASDRDALSRFYFKNQMENFIDAPNINPTYAKLLLDNKTWIDDVQSNRDGLAHKASVFLSLDNDKVMFSKRRPLDDNVPLHKLPREDLLQYLDNTDESLYKFLDSYTAIHRDRVPISQQARFMLDSLDNDKLQALM